MVGFWCDTESTKGAPDAVYRCPARPGNLARRRGYGPCPARPAAPGPRRGQGTRFALPALLTLAVTALLANHLSLLAIAEWGASQPGHVLQPLGFPEGVTPHQSTLHRLFRRLDPVALSTALSRGFDRATAPPHQRVRGAAGVAIDGKAQRGRLAFDRSGTPIHALWAYPPIS